MKNQGILKLLTLFSFLMLLAFSVSCSSDDGVKLTADEQDIESQIEDELEDLVGFGALEEEDESDLEDEGTIAEELNQLAKSSSDSVVFMGYARKIRIRRDRFVVIVNNDTSEATAEITYRFTGQFVVVKFNRNTRIRTVTTKPLEHRVHRTVVFEKNTDSNAVHRWKAKSVSMGFGISENGTMSLTGNMRILIENSEGVVAEHITSDPLNYFFAPDDIPAVNQGDTVTVEVAIANADPADAPVGVMHRARNARRSDVRHKHRFNDQGLGPDLVVGDGIYTAQWVAQGDGILGRHVGVLDFFTTSALMNSDAPYNSLIIAVPYIRP